LYTDNMTCRSTIYPDRT